MTCLHSKCFTNDSSEDRLSQSIQFINTLFFLVDNILIDHQQSRRRYDVATDPTVTMDDVLQICEIVETYLPFIFDIYDQYISQNAYIKKQKIEYQREYEKNHFKLRLNDNNNNNGNNNGNEKHSIAYNIEQQHEITKQCVKAMEKFIIEKEKQQKYPKTLYPDCESAICNIFSCLDAISAIMDDGLEGAT